MKYERVYMVWEFYDGIRSGIADIQGVPHYFDCQFDSAAGDYFDYFKVCPVDAEVMLHATCSWDIYRAWERRFHGGRAKLDTHPGHGNIDAEYDRLQVWLNQRLKEFQPSPILYRAEFLTLPNQDGLPSGMLREIEVAWSPQPA